MSRKLIYLSGMMDGVTEAEGNEWRMQATRFFNDRGFDTFNPYKIHPVNSGCEPNEIHVNDLYYLERADVVLANMVLPPRLENSKIPFFTIGELYLAHAAKKPVVAFTNCLGERLSYKAIVTKGFTNLEDAMEYVASVY